MATFIDLRFHAVGERAHRDTVAAIEGIPGVDVLLDHTRELGWLERQRLMVSEWDCRIVVGVRDSTERWQVDRHESNERDPYRTIEFGGPVRQVPSKLAELIEAIGAEHTLVERGWLRFETRVYEAELLDGLEQELRNTGGEYVHAVFERRAGVLYGRIEGQIPVVQLLHRALPRSGMVDAEHVLVGYQ